MLVGAAGLSAVNRPGVSGGLYDLAVAVENLRTTRERFKRDIDESQNNLDERRNAILSELNDEFQSFVWILGASPESKQLASTRRPICHC